MSGVAKNFDVFDFGYELFDAQLQVLRLFSRPDAFSLHSSNGGANYLSVALFPSTRQFAKRDGARHVNLVKEDVEQAINNFTARFDNGI